MLQVHCLTLSTRRVTWQMDKMTNRFDGGSMKSAIICMRTSMVNQIGDGVHVRR